MKINVQTGNAGIWPSEKPRSSEKFQFSRILSAKYPPPAKNTWVISVKQGTHNNNVPAPTYIACRFYPSTLFLILYTDPSAIRNPNPVTPPIPCKPESPIPEGK